MKENKGVRKANVLLIYRKMIPSILLCGHSQLDYLSKNNQINYKYKQCMELKTNDINMADIIILGRLDSWYEYQITKLCKKANKYIAYIIDDDLLNVPVEVSSASYYRQDDIRFYINNMIEMSDAIISPSPYLLNMYGNDKYQIQIEEPALNQTTYEKHNENKPVKIGFAGSIDRIANIDDLLKNVLINIKNKYKEKVEFEFFGAIPSFAKEVGAKCISYTDSYKKYKDILNSLKWDIGLAPMPNSSFYACKHYNKYIEYSASGIVGIYSNVMPYTRLSNIAKNIILCDNQEEKWQNAIEELIEDRERLEDYRKAICNQKFLELSVISSDFLDKINKVNINTQNTININKVTWINLKIKGLYKRLVDKLKRLLKINISNNKM